MNKVLPFSIVLASLLTAGCTQRLVDFTTISSKNIDLSRGAEFERASKRVTGEDVAHIVFVIPMGNPNTKEAMDRAIESQPGAVALMDGVVTSSWWYIPYIYGQAKITVEGTPLVDPKLVR